MLSDSTNALPATTQRLHSSLSLSLYVHCVQYSRHTKKSNANLLVRIVIIQIPPPEKEITIFSFFPFLIILFFIGSIVFVFISCFSYFTMGWHIKRREKKSIRRENSWSGKFEIEKKKKTKNLVDFLKRVLFCFFFTFLVKYLERHSLDCGFFWCSTWTPNRNHQSGTSVVVVVTLFYFSASSFWHGPKVSSHLDDDDDEREREKKE